MNTTNDIGTASLSGLRIGAQAVVAAVTGAPPLRRRLLEMGLVPGTPVTLVCRAPLGDPLIVRVRGYEVGLRTSEARAVVLR